ncbi:hypothetical protein [Scytonema sp. PRP1]|uniref:hypothetical protein n=1 Tax=Scytonema sp. PRP1 TaxID=3120513 RepID=UPI002FD393EE
MNEPKFHTVDSESLKNISVEQILRQHNPALENADYTTPVPTENQTIPHRDGTDRYYIKVIKGWNPIVKPNLDSAYRGRIGGC